MIKAIIIDDEQHCINSLESLLAEHCSHTIELKGAFQSVDEAISEVRQLQPDLVFLDVEIGAQTGFDFLIQIPEINFEVIFTTAHDKYAVQAFKFSAIHYLLKPLRADDLMSAINKLKNKISKEYISEKMDTLFHNLKTIKGTGKKICIPIQTGLIFLDTSDITRCESSINYTTIFTNDKKKLLVSKTLKEFEELLSEYGFFRVHQSHLINLNSIKSYNKGKGGFITMEDGSDIEVSTRRKDEFLRRMAIL